MRFDRFRMIGCFMAFLLVSACGGSSMPKDSCDPETGSCEQVCGGLPLPEMSTACDADQVCERPADSCRIADLQGVCVAKPELCPEIYQPVCACNGQTYGNNTLIVSCRRTRTAGGPKVTKARSRINSRITLRRLLPNGYRHHRSPALFQCYCGVNKGREKASGQT